MVIFMETKRRQQAFGPLQATQPWGERVYGVLEESIVDGAMAPGAPLRARLAAAHSSEHDRARLEDTRSRSLCFAGFRWTVATPTEYLTHQPPPGGPSVRDDAARRGFEYIICR